MERVIQLHTFGRGGIHPDPMKRETRDRPIEPIAPLPSDVWLPLLQHIGEPSQPLVKKGDKVVRGQKIADGGPNGVPLHATVSGKVRPIERRPHPTLVLADSIAIQREGEAELEFPQDPGWRGISREEALERIREAGIVGLGGAAFPTHRKLSLPKGVAVDTLVLNGAECEPYLTSDYRLMLAEPEAIVEGAFAMARIVGVRRILVGIETDKGKAIDALRDAAAEIQSALVESGISFVVVPCEVRYPQGAERQL
ncbi:MAG TPA: electron transport complex subunit RsxC, partial [Candidatus Eisenbacteria bacterium]|nr:electron transport complex subunit RsxC [Candidatus Eisenbacteria bacterium]